MQPIALQTYTLRDALDQDFAGTLELIAQLGYKGIETAGTYGRTPADLARAAAGLGLAIVSNHGALPTAATLGQILDIQGGLGSTRLVAGFGPDDLKTAAGCLAAAEKLEAAAAMLAPHGVSVHMHNHYWEFHPVEDGRLPFEIMLEAAPSVFSELDLYWVAFGGASPVKVLGRWGHRVQLAHVKDGLLGSQYHFKALGEGQVDLPAAIGALDASVTQWLIVEQDASDGDMSRDVQVAYEYLVGKRLAAGNR